MAELSMEAILERVRENKAALEKKDAEIAAGLERAMKSEAEAASLKDGLEPLRQQLAEKDEVIEDLLSQNQELQENLSALESECQKIKAEAEEKKGMMEKLSELLA